MSPNQICTPHRPCNHCGHTVLYMSPDGDRFRVLCGSCEDLGPPGDDAGAALRRWDDENQNDLIYVLKRGEAGEFFAGWFDAPPVADHTFAHYWDVRKDALDRASYMNLHEDDVALHWRVIGVPVFPLPQYPAGGAG